MPLNTVLASLAITVLLSLIVLGSAAALASPISLVFSALYTSYLISCGLLLWQRYTGALEPYTGEFSTIYSDRLEWGPWKLPEPLGIINNVFSCIYILFVLFRSF